MLRTVLLVLLVAAVIAGGSYYAYYHQATPKVEIVAKQIRVAEDPRLVFPTPYLNVRPEVKYVGDAACSQCHEREASSYHHHPMGISSAFVSDALPVEKYDAKAHNPFEKFGFQFSVEREGGKLYHTVTKRDAQKKELFKVKHEVLLAVGSGNNSDSEYGSKPARK